MFILEMIAMVLLYTIPVGMVISVVYSIISVIQCMHYMNKETVIENGDLV